ncbi:MAG TPA: NADPH-dependent ferric siderophore reductase, partial [Stenotrophomonas sp.]|nr:NADPH-dependent ferric siderophore reductase [Stenotrophomonas sp.]
MALHENKLLRHTVKFRPLQVLRTEEISPCMRRVIVGGPALEGFDSPSPDDHVKLFFPNAEGQFVV